MGKSKLHIELAQRALTWLEVRATGRGIRGCEEVALAEGYVADAVAISGLTYANQQLFVGTKRDWNQKEADTYAWVFESKVSRSDFIKTFKRDGHFGSRLNPIANFHLIVCPRGMIKADEVPEFWGLLEQRGAGLGVVKMPTMIPLDTMKLYEISYCILRSGHYGKFGIYSSQVNDFRQEQLILEDAGGALLEKVKK